MIFCYSGCGWDLPALSNAESVAEDVDEGQLLVLPHQDPVQLDPLAEESPEGIGIEIDFFALTVPYEFLNNIIQIIGDLSGALPVVAQDKNLSSIKVVLGKSQVVIDVCSGQSLLNLI